MPKIAEVGKIKINSVKVSYGVTIVKGVQE